MMKIIKKHDLKYETVFPYFIDHVRYGNTLSCKIGKLINFHDGRFFTILPDTIDESKLQSFNSAIIPPSESSHVTSMDGESAEFVKSFLQKDSQNCMVNEDAILKLEEALDRNDNIKVLLYENEICYLLTAMNTIEEIFSSMKYGKFWHTLIILTSFEYADDLHELDNIVLNVFCENVKYVLARAYGGDSYIFWQKNDNLISK